MGYGELCVSAFVGLYGLGCNWAVHAEWRRLG